MTSKKPIAEVVCTLLFGVGGVLCGSAIERYNTKVIPKTNQVQQGYIAPSRLEIECEDLDADGIPQTILKIDDVPYLLREVDGKPVLSAYEVKKPEVIVLPEDYKKPVEAVPK